MRRRAVALATVAMALNFLWFDLPGHGTAFLAHDLLLRHAFADGHTLFLTGMLLASLTACAVPRWLERHKGTALSACAVLGTASAALQFSDVPLALSALAAVGTGYTNIVLLIAEVLLFSRIADRKVAGVAVIAVFVLRGALMYGADAVLGETNERALFCLLPALCTGLTWAARRAEGQAVAPMKSVTFERPLSTVMLGLVVISSVAFAIACAVGNTGFWGNPFALTGEGLGPLVAGSAVFCAVSYVTLVKTESSLLLRFMPGLLVLFAIYLFLYSGTSQLLPLDPAALATIEHFAEYYGEEFSWFVLLLALNALEMRPWRLVGLSFSVNAGVTVAFQYLILFDEGLNLVIVQLGFLAMLAMLVWTLYHFYGIGNSLRDLQGRADAAHEDTPRSAAAAAEKASGETGVHPPGAAQMPAAIVTVSDPPGSDGLRALAKSLGLSERETDVFLLLARGNSRRLICEKLFIADGTASTHIGRIYEKAGVASKQELLLLVQEWEERGVARGARGGEMA